MHHVKDFCLFDILWLKLIIIVIIYRLKGVCIENGLLLSFYDEGILCWKAETGEPAEEITMETGVIVSGNYVIYLEEDKIFVRHSITHLLSVSGEDQ